MAVPRELFAVILERIQRFGVPPLLVQRGWRRRLEAADGFVRTALEARRAPPATIRE